MTAMTGPGTGERRRAAHGVCVSLCWLRGGVLGLVAMLLAYGGHVVGGGDPLAARELVVPVAFSAVLCVVLSRRRLSFPALLTALGGSQLGFHLWFQLGDLLDSHAHASTTGTTPMGMGQMHGGPGLMITAHAVAATVSAALLLAGENGLWNLLAVLAQRLWVAVSVFVAAPARSWPALVSVTADAASWTSRRVGSVQSRRGPPALLPV